MSGPATTVTIKGGPNDGETFDMPVNQLKIGVRTVYLGVPCTISQDGSGPWVYAADQI